MPRQSPLSPPGSVLCYHGICDDTLQARARFHVRVEQLAECLALLRNMGELIPLMDLLEQISAGKGVRGLFALTFDDAYESVARIALPVLRAYRAPAAVFAVSTTCAHGGRFWWDRLEDLAPHVDPARWHAFVHAFGLGRDHVLARGHGRLTPEQDEALASLEREAGFVTPMRSLTGPELVGLARDPLISVGPHTATHAALATLPDADVVAEIVASHLALVELGLTPIPVLAAPYGSGDDRTVPLAQQAGMRWTLGVAPRNLRGAAATRPVPRYVMSPSRAGARFALQLSGATGLIKRLLAHPEPDWPAN